MFQEQAAAADAAPDPAPHLHRLIGLFPQDGAAHLQRLGQADEEAAPGAELRRAHANAGAVADFVFLVRDIDDVQPRRQAAAKRLKSNSWLTPRLTVT